MFGIKHPVGWALIFSIYGAAALAAASLSNSVPLPGFVQKLIVVFQAPLFIFEWPFDSLLKRFGLVVTAYWSYPTTTGFVLVILFWSVVIFLAGMLLRKFGSV